MKWNVFISLELTKHPGPLWLFLFIYLFVCFLPFFLPFFFFTPSPPPPPPLLPPFVIFFRFCFRYSKSVDWKFYAQQISTSLSPANDQRVETMDNAEAYICVHTYMRACVRIRSKFYNSRYIGPFIDRNVFSSEFVRSRGRGTSMEHAANDDPAKPSSHLRIEYQDSSSAINAQQNRTMWRLDRWRWRWINNETRYPDLYDP